MTNSQPREPLKVLHIISGDLWAGAEVQAYTLLSHLQAYCTVSAVVMNEGELAKRLRNKGISVTVIDETRHTSFQIFSRLRVALQEIRPDVIHTHRQKENILGSLANLTTLRAACLRTVHGAPEYKGNWKAQLQRAIDNKIANQVQHGVISVSAALKVKLSQSVNPRKIQVIENGVDISPLKNSAQYNDIKTTQENKINIGFIGRLSPVKRVDFFIKIAEEFQNQSDNYHFHIIGDGQIRQEIATLVKSRNLEHLVTMHGHRNDIPSCIKSLDALLLCSEHEGLPMILLESLALGKPVGSHLDGSVAEILEAHSIPKIEEQSLIKYKEWILNLENLPKTIGLNSKFYAEENAKATAAYYQEIC